MHPDAREFICIINLCDPSGQIEYATVAGNPNNFHHVWNAQNVAAPLNDESLLHPTSHYATPTFPTKLGTTFSENCRVSKKGGTNVVMVGCHSGLIRHL